jgi:hypothetical protein
MVISSTGDVMTRTYNAPFIFVRRVFQPPEESQKKNYSNPHAIFTDFNAIR